MLVPHLSGVKVYRKLIMTRSKMDEILISGNVAIEKTNPRDGRAVDLSAVLRTQCNLQYSPIENLIFTSTSICRFHIRPLLSITMITSYFFGHQCPGSNI